MKTSKSTLIRTAFLFASLFILDLIVIFGCIAMMKQGLIYSAEAVGVLGTLITTNGAALTCWWKNNSFSEAAKSLDPILAVIKEKGDGIVKKYMVEMIDKINAEIEEADHDKDKA